MNKLSDDVIKQLQTDPYNYANQLSKKELQKLLEKLADIYYNTGTSIVNDNIYDILKDLLEKRS